MSELPKGWAKTTVGEVLFFNYGKSLAAQSRKGGPVNVYGSNGIVGSHDEALTRAPAIIVGRKGSFGEVHISPEPCFPIDTTYYVDDFPATEAGYAYSLLRFLPLKEMNRASAIPGLNREDAHALEVPLPPLAEQKRIVRKLDTLSARTTTARTHLAAIVKLVERYKRGIYDCHFANAGERVPLGDLAKVGTGATPKKGNPRYYDDGNVPWVTSGAVNDKTVNEPSGYITETALTETNCKLFPAGSLLMAMYGEGKTRGQVARLGIEAATNQALAVIHEIDVQKVNVDYLYLFLDSIYLEIRELAEGGVQPNLSLGKVKSFELPLPSIEDQRKIVSLIEMAFAKIDRQAAEAEKVLKLIERLDDRVLAKAFAGELVPQDPNDEPASVLLDRIREARANAPKKTRPRRTKATAMKKDPKDLLLADIAKWPANGVTSEELAKRVVMPRDDLRDALFELLSGAKPQLEQVFDKDEERMRLKRVAQ